ncbi:MAG: glycosyltransferase A (GT-A) superfamily protein (DUF2064 family) [Ilumatobacter sp.]|jgi:glycosyltransferase A (GT-A) superfamily protein (DUF2064 family)
MTASFHITVMAKEPIVGQVKTRMVPPLNSEQAAQIAAACLHDTFAAVSVVCGAHDDVRAVALIDGAAGSWIPADYDVHHQSGDGLGERLANGFSILGPGLIIGMDTPSAGVHFEAALDALRTGNDAIGMTYDGGYWGIALASAEPTVFDNVPMSTDRTGQAQLDQLRRLDRRVTVLPTVHDLGHFEDIAPIVADLPGSHLASVAVSLFNRHWG